MKQSMEAKGLLRTTNIFEEPLAKGSCLHSWIFSYLPKKNLVHLLTVVLSSILIWHFYFCRVDGLRNCLEVSLPKRTAQVGTFSCSHHVLTFLLGGHEFRMRFFSLLRMGRGWTHYSVGVFSVEPKFHEMMVVIHYILLDQVYNEQTSMKKYGIF